MPLAGVEAAFAAAKPDGSGGKRVIGYVCPLSVDVAVVLDTCRARLVSAAVPTLIVPLERLPMLPNGKVDMKALPVPAVGPTAEAPEPPADELEAGIEAIWRKALGLSVPVSVTSDFFAIGGTSLQVGGLGAHLLGRQHGARPGLPAGCCGDRRASRVDRL